MTKIVDSYRFISGMSKRLIRSWIKLESPRAIPWTPLSKPLSDSTVVLISTGRIATLAGTDRALGARYLEVCLPLLVGCFQGGCFAHPAMRLSFTGMPLSKWL